MLDLTQLELMRRRNQELIHEAENSRMLKQTRASSGEGVNGVESGVSRFYQAALGRLDAVATRWLTRYSIPLLRISLGLVFLGFGVLKFVPGLSPAEDFAQQTMSALTFGLVPATVGLVLVAAMESAIGLSLITGRHLQAGLVLLGVAMIGILSPLALFPDQLFQQPFSPTLEGQYVAKDVVLFSSGLVIAARERGVRMIPPNE